MLHATYERLPLLALAGLRNHVAHFETAISTRRLHVSEQQNDIYMITGGR